MHTLQWTLLKSDEGVRVDSSVFGKSQVSLTSLTRNELSRKTCSCMHVMLTVLHQDVCLRSFGGFSFRKSSPLRRSPGLHSKMFDGRSILINSDAHMRRNTSVFFHKSLRNLRKTMQPDFLKMGTLGAVIVGPWG